MALKPHVDKNGVFVTEEFWNAENDPRALSHYRRKLFDDRQVEELVQAENLEECIHELNQSVSVITAEVDTGKTLTKVPEITKRFGKACIELGRAIERERSLGESAEVEATHACEFFFWLTKFDLSIGVLQTHALDHPPEGYPYDDWEYFGEKAKELERCASAIIVLLLNRAGFSINQYLLYGGLMENFSMPRGSLQDILEYELNLQEGARYEDEFEGERSE